MKKENKVMTSFMIEKETLARLTEEARNDGRSRSQFLRRMVETCLETLKESESHELGAVP